MTRTKTILTNLALGTAAMGWSGAALAGHAEIYGPRADAFAYAMAHQGPHVAQAAVHIVNGVVQDSRTGPGGTIDAGPLAPGATGVFAAATQPGGSNGGDYLYAESHAAANLADGTLRGSVFSVGPNNFGTPGGGSQTRLDDTVYFTNITGGDLLVRFTLSFEGVLSDPFEGNPGGNVSLGLSCAYYNCFNDAGASIRFASHPSRAADGNMNYYFSESGPSYFGENIYGGMNDFFQTGLDPLNGIDGNVIGYITTGLLIPTGETSMGFSAVMNLYCGGGSSCSFGHTARLGFGDLPEGLSFSSASGVFLTDTGVPSGAVPEPATWAMMIAGFAFAGSALRRQRSMLAGVVY